MCGAAAHLKITKVIGTTGLEGVLLRGNPDEGRRSLQELLKDILELAARQLECSFELRTEITVRCIVASPPRFIRVVIAEAQERSDS